MNHKEFLEIVQADPNFKDFLIHEAKLISRANTNEIEWHIDSLRKNFYLWRESFQLAALVDYLDTHEVHISTYYNIRERWNFEIENLKGSYHRHNNYSSRPNATRAGILKALSLLKTEIN